MIDLTSLLPATGAETSMRGLPGFPIEAGQNQAFAENLLAVLQGIDPSRDPIDLLQELSTDPQLPELNPWLAALLNNQVLPPGGSDLPLSVDGEMDASAALLPQPMAANIATAMLGKQPGLLHQADASTPEPELLPTVATDQLADESNLQALFKGSHTDLDASVINKLPELSMLAKPQALVNSTELMNQPAMNLHSLHQTSSLTTASSGVTTTIPLSTSNHAELANGLGTRIVWMANNQQQTAEIQLDPPELGHLGVHLKIHGEHAQLFFSAEHSAARETIESALPKLREMLQEAGFGRVDVNVSHQQQQDKHAAHTFTQGADSLGSELVDEQAATTTSKTQVVHQQGLVDYYA